MNSPSSWPTHTMVILRKPLHARSTRHFLVYELVIIARQNSDARYWCEIYVCLSVCPSGCGILFLRLRILSNFFYHLWDISLVF